jgi:N-acetylneuraminate lyase
VAMAAGIPLLIYHIPALTNQNLSVENLAQLLDIPGVVGLKFSDANLFTVKRLLIARPGTIIFNGNDELLCLGLMYGAVGGIGMTYNLLPRLFVRMYEAAAKRDWERALAIQHAYMPYLNVLAKYGIFAAGDFLMRHGGMEAFSFRRPREVLDQGTGATLLKELEPVVREINAVVD